MHITIYEPYTYQGLSIQPHYFQPNLIRCDGTFNSKMMCRTAVLTIY
jgi:hypothetical protein